MSRTHSHRRHKQRSYNGDRHQAGFTPGLAIVGSFVLGVILELARTRFPIFRADWRADTLAILVAAWICGFLLTRASGLSEHELPRWSGLSLGLLLLGSVITHQLINHG